MPSGRWTRIGNENVLTAYYNFQNDIHNLKLEMPYISIIYAVYLISFALLSFSLIRLMLQNREKEPSKKILNMTSKGIIITKILKFNFQ